MKRLLLFLVAVAIAAPAAAQESNARKAAARGHFARLWAPQDFGIRGGADQDGLVVVASAFLGRPSDRGGLQAEVALHGDRWMQVPLVLHGDLYKGRGKMLYVAVGPALIVDLREKDGQRASAALSAGAGYEHGRFVVDARYTSGKNAFAATAGVTFR